MNSLDKQYLELLQDILVNGATKSDRTGTGTISVFGRQIRHKMSEGFPLLTTKKMAWKTMVTELLWFLRGDTNIKFLVDNNCHIWDGDAYKNYLKWAGNNPLTIEEFIEKIKTDSDFAGVYGDLGPVYGKQWRSWKHLENHNFTKITYVKTVDQIANLINDLKTNPDSRRLMVTAWNPADLETSVLPPCHYGFQVYTRELSLKERRNISNSIQNDIHYGETISPMAVEHWDRINTPTRAISLMWNQRSCDFPLGIPFNVASYGLLLEIIAKEVNMVPDELIGNLGDCHIYLNQIDGVKEQLTREPFELPTLSMDYREGEYDKELKGFVPDDFVLFNYQSHPSIKMPLSN